MGDLPWDIQSVELTEDFKAQHVGQEEYFQSDSSILDQLSNDP